MLKIPTVDDWYRLSLKYRQFHRVGNTVLKDYGYMAIMDYLDSHDGNNILEFGHGFNAALFEQHGYARNVWGVDDYQGLAYFGTPDRDAWGKRFDQEVRSKAPECSRSADLPDNCFDVVCSVSVLDGESRFGRFGPIPALRDRFNRRPLAIPCGFPHLTVYFGSERVDAICDGSGACTVAGG